MSNKGKFVDNTPFIPFAGITTALEGVSVDNSIRQDLYYKPSTQTPEEILKYTVRYGTLKTANLIKPDVAGAYGIVKYISNIKHSKNIGSRIQLIEEQTFLDNVLQSVKSLFGSKSKKIK